jgi:hypothetical protein
MFQPGEANQKSESGRGKSKSKSKGKELIALQPPPGDGFLNSNLQQAGHLDVFDVERNQVSGYLL